jgi:site-specific DNA recombinase
MDRVRDLVLAGGVSVVLAQDRDRFTREPAHHYLLKREFEEHGCKLRALNDRGDDSPEGELTDGILDQLAKFERAKTAERTRRGKLRKAREGKVIATTKPPYGFRYNVSRNALINYEPEMLVVRKIFRLAAEGFGTYVIQKRLYQENIPSPRGNRSWHRKIIKELVISDVYKPHSYKEITQLVSPEVAAMLDPDQEYGVRWWNRLSRKTQHVSEPDRDGQRSYRKRTTATTRGREEWVAVPVPAHLSRSLVEQARAMLLAYRPPQRKHLARSWQLRGQIRCGNCGVAMGTHTTRNGEKLYHYYKCKCRDDYKRGTCNQKNIRAEKVERPVWEFVSDLLKSPERINAGMEVLIEQERAADGHDPEKEFVAWADKIEKCDHLRKAYQDQQAAGLMTMEELRERLEELESARRLAQTEIEILTEHEERMKQLEKDRVTVLNHISKTIPDAVNNLSPEEQNDLYRMLHLEVTPSDEGFKVSGAFCVPEPLSDRRNGQLGAARSYRLRRHKDLRRADGPGAWQGREFYRGGVLPVGPSQLSAATLYRARRGGRDDRLRLQPGLLGHQRRLPSCRRWRSPFGDLKVVSAGALR